MSSNSPNISKKQLCASIGLEPNNMSTCRETQECLSQRSGDKTFRTLVRQHDADFTNSNKENIENQNRMISGTKASSFSKGISFASAYKNNSSGIHRMRKAHTILPQVHATEPEDDQERVELEECDQEIIKICARQCYGPSQDENKTSQNENTKAIEQSRQSSGRFCVPFEVAISPPGSPNTTRFTSFLQEHKRVKRPLSRCTKDSKSSFIFTTRKSSGGNTARLQASRCSAFQKM